MRIANKYVGHSIVQTVTRITIIYITPYMPRAMQWTFSYGWLQ